MHKDDDLTMDHHIMNFDDKNLWFVKRKAGEEDHFVNARFNIHTESKTLQINIKDSEDKRFNGNYNLYIDTIQNNEEDYIIRLTLDSEKTFIEAIRSKLKYYSYDEYKKQTNQ